MKCVFCEAELIWNSDENAEDIFDNEELVNRVLSSYTCPKCGAEYEIISPDPGKWENLGHADGQDVG